MKSRSMLFVFVVLALLLAACGPQGMPVPADPVEAVKLIADKQKEIKSQHLDVSLDLGLKLNGIEAPDASSQQALALFKNFKGNLTLTGDVDTEKNDAALKGSLDLGALTALLAQGNETLEFELVKVGDKLYTKALDQDWQESDVKMPADTDQPADSNADFNAAQLSELLKKAAKAEKLNDEAIDGVDSYHYKVTLDPLTLIQEAAKLAQSTAGAEPIDQAQLDEAKKFLQDSVVIVEVWVGKQDLFIRQQKIAFDLTLKDLPEQPAEATAIINLAINTKTTKINEPVTITAPK